MKNEKYADTDRQAGTIEVVVNILAKIAGWFFETVWAVGAGVLAAVVVTLPLQILRSASRAPFSFSLPI